MKKNEKNQQNEEAVNEAKVSELDPKDAEIASLNEIIKGLEAEKAETNDKYLRTPHAC